MGTITLKSVVEQVQRTLQDEGAGVQWPQGELLHYANQTYKDIADKDPSLYTRTANFTLAAGAEQVAPSDCTRIIKPISNMGTAGATPGKTVFWQPYEDFVRFKPDFRNDSSDTEIKYFLQPEGERKYYYCYPPASATTYVRVNYEAIPSDGTINGVNGGSSDSVIPFDNTKMTMLWAGILRLAFSKEGADGNSMFADKYDGLFNREFQIDMAVDRVTKSKRLGEDD